MNDLLAKLRRVLERIESERGPFVLFGLFLLEESASENWDLVVSVPWLNDDHLDGMRYIARKLNKVFIPTEMLAFSGIVPMDTTDPSVKSLAEWAEHQQMPLVVGNFDFSRDRIRTAYILAANPLISSSPVGKVPSKA